MKHRKLTTMREGKENGEPHYQAREGHGNKFIATTLKSDMLKCLVGQNQQSLLDIFIFFQNKFAT